jgi:hypothetical protein
MAPSPSNPPVANTPPVIKAMSAMGAAPQEPAQYATLDESVTVSATVEDAETPVSQLTFTWSADTGSFSGAGPTVSWTAPHEFRTPGTATLTLVVTERYQTTDASGRAVTAENQVRGTTAVRLHNSPKEVGDLAVLFLEDFSKQIDPLLVVRNFSLSCSGRGDELFDVEKDNRDFTMNSYSIGTPATTVGFTGRCPFRNVRGDACAFVPVEWHSTLKATGARTTAIGTDQVTAIYEDGQWRLCASDFDQITGSAVRFKDWARP